MFDGFIVCPVTEHAGVQRPLRAPPGFPGMDGAAFIKKNAMPIDNLHLDDIAADTKVFFLHLVNGEM